MAQEADGILIEVKRNVVAQKHLLIRTINDIEPQQHVLPCHCVVVLEPYSSLKLSEVQEGSGAGMALALHEIHLGNGANLRHSQIQLWGSKHECIQQVLVAQQKESHYAHFAYCGGGGKVRNQLTIMQDGQLSHTELTGLVLPGAFEHIDNQTYMCHRSPNSSSRQRYRSLVGREGTSVFNGKVLVDPEAQKTDAYQHHASLLMHETAVSNAKPELEIYADDVKCSHGATTGMLDAGEIHYMRSRGLSEFQARIMLQEAFLRDLLDSLPDESLRNYCFSHCIERLRELNQQSR
jgi:Fe-S cluster assembly protein SufD